MVLKSVTPARSLFCWGPRDDCIDGKRYCPVWNCGRAKVEVFGLQGGANMRCWLRSAAMNDGHESDCWRAHESAAYQQPITTSDSKKVLNLQNRLKWRWQAQPTSRLGPQAWRRNWHPHLLNSAMIFACARVLKCKLKPTTAADVSTFTSSLSDFTANTVKR